MENTSVNKTKFFSQYMYQRVFAFGCPALNGDPDDGQLFILNATTLTQNGETSYLGLKPIKSITNEDIIKISEKFSYKNPKIRRNNLNLTIKPENFKSEHIEIRFNPLKITINDDFSVLHKPLYTPSRLIQEVIDWLRSEGYAVPYMNLNVQELVEYGWVKLIEDNVTN